jgi:outer membrane receptor protein involved in Fe transport
MGSFPLVALYAPSAFAQEADTKGVQEVVVTGSRIIRQDYVATSPVVTVSADTFKLSGEVQVETVLNSLPQLVPSITTTSNNPSNGGQANVDLRGLSGNSLAPRTLVLLEGTRLPASGTQGAVDLNIIPAGLIENIEILTGGASSTYGSDAIAGVVNVRLKRDFSGIELSAQSNRTAESDGNTNQFQALMGGNFQDGRGNAVLFLGYDDRDAVLAGARDFGKVTRGANLAPVGSGTIPDGSIAWGTNQPSQAAVDAAFAPFGAPAGQVSRGGVIGFNADQSIFAIGSGTAAQPAVHYLGDTNDPGFNPLAYSYNFGPVNYLQLPISRKQIAGFARYDMVPDKAEMYTRLLYTTYSADQQLASTPVSSCSPGQPGCAIPLTNSTIPQAIKDMAATRTNATAPLLYTKRYTEVGPRIQDNNFDVTQGLLGFRGNFDLAGKRWGWDLYGSWGRVQATQQQAGNISRARLQAAYDNPAVYAAQGCATFNPFGLGSLTPQCAQAISIATTNIFESQLTNVVGSLTGSLFALPAGDVQFALGSEYRRDEGQFKPDTFLASGDVVGFNANQPVKGTISAKEYFGELSVPLLKDLPAIESLVLELGYRKSDYNLAGSFNTYKGALQWNAMPSVKIRGSYNRAIRAPGLQELFLPQQENFPQYTDPCNATSSFRTGANGAQVAALCQAQGIPANVLATFKAPTQARSFIGGNLNLKPENADTYTLGVTWQSTAQSDWLANLSTSLDYFRYDISDMIAQPQVGALVGRCFNQVGTNSSYDPNNPTCQTFSRDPGDFRVSEVNAFSQNLSNFKMNGVDWNLDWRLPMTVFGASESAGRLDFKMLLTRLLKVQQQEVSSDPLANRLGTIGQTVGSAFPKWKSVLATTYSVGSLQFRYNARFIDSMDAVNNDVTLSHPTAGVKPHTPAYLYHDLTARWLVNDMFGVTLGVVNIADKQPPIYTTDAQAGIQDNTDPSTYDVLGRRYFLSATAKF